MTSWTFLAASSWMIVATLGFVASILSLLLLMLVEFALVVGIGAAVIPVLLARAIIDGSATTATVAALHAFGFGAYLLSSDGPSMALLVLAWLVFASVMAAREAAQRSHGQGSLR